MASTFTTQQAGNSQPAISTSESGETVAVRGVFDLAVDGIGALVINDVINMVKLPAGHVIVDCIVDTDDLDTNGTPTIVFSAGLTSGGTNAELISLSSQMKTGGVARMDQTAGVRLAATDADRNIGIKVTTAPATGTATGKVGLTLVYRAKSWGE